METTAKSTTARRFHAGMACALLVLVAATFVVSRIAGVRVQHPGSLVVAIVMVLVIVLPLPVYWHEKGHIERREAALMILAAAAFAVILPLSVTAVARLGGPLRDGLFVRIDGAMGVSTPAIARWAAHHRIGRIINSSYGLLLPFLPFSILALRAERKMVPGASVCHLKPRSVCHWAAAVRSTAGGRAVAWIQDAAKYFAG